MENGVYCEDCGRATAEYYCVYCWRKEQKRKIDKMQKEINRILEDADRKAWELRDKILEIEYNLTNPQNNNRPPIGSIT